MVTNACLIENMSRTTYLDVRFGNPLIHLVFLATKKTGHLMYFEMR